MASNIHKRRKKNKKRRPPKHLDLKKLFSVMLSVFSLIGITGFLLWYFSFDTLDVDDVLALSYSGYNKKGTVSLSFAEDMAHSAFLDNAKLQLLSENGNLANGDLLEIRLIYDKNDAKAQGIRIKEDTCQVEVKGLPKGKRLSSEELFKGLEISYEGIAPALTITVANTSSDPFLQTIEYELIEPKDFYASDDTFSVKAELSEEEAIKNEYILPSSEDAYISEYTLDNRDRYLRDASELSASHIEALNQAANSLFGKADEYGLRIFSEANLMPIWINGKTTFMWSNPRLISVYLSCLKPEYFEAMQSHNNDVKLVYLATLSQADGVACDAEVVVQFNDLLIRADGSYDLSLDSGQIVAASFKDSHIKDLVNASYNKEYESEKLTFE